MDHDTPPWHPPCCLCIKQAKRIYVPCLVVHLSRAHIQKCDTFPVSRLWTDDFRVRKSLKILTVIFFKTMSHVYISLTGQLPQSGRNNDFAFVSARVEWKGWVTFSPLLTFVLHQVFFLWDKACESTLVEPRLWATDKMQWKTGFPSALFLTRMCHLRLHWHRAEK